MRKKKDFILQMNEMSYLDKQKLYFRAMVKVVEESCAFWKMSTSFLSPPPPTSPSFARSKILLYVYEQVCVNMLVDIHMQIFQTDNITFVKEITDMKN